MISVMLCYLEQSRIYKKALHSIGVTIPIDQTVAGRVKCKNGSRFLQDANRVIDNAVSGRSWRLSPGPVVRFGAAAMVPRGSGSGGGGDSGFNFGGGVSGTKAPPIVHPKKNTLIGKGAFYSGGVRRF